MNVTAFTVTMNKQQLALACSKACPVGAVNCPPVQEVRVLTVDIAGQAPSDASVQRSVRTTVRLRNDNHIGNCPA